MLLFLDIKYNPFENNENELINAIPNPKTISNFSRQSYKELISYTSSLRVEKSQLKGKNNFDLFIGMVAKKKIKDFKDLDQFPDLKEALVPAIKTLPSGSMNTKVIVTEGEIVERVYKTPKGEIISLLANDLSKQAA